MTTQIPKGAIRFFAAATLALPAIDAYAVSRIGTAVVKMVDGEPCFSIPLDRETRKGLPFYGLLVSDIDPVGADRGREERWRWNMHMTPPGASVLLLPSDCIRYGQALPSSEHPILQPLQTYRQYAVNLSAKPGNTSLVGYSAYFCLVPGANGTPEVRIMPDEPDLRPAWVLACTPPAPANDARQ